MHELEQFNPQLADKPRVLAISKSDMLDNELMSEIDPTLPGDVPHLYISAVTGQGLTELKDLLWKEINDERNIINPEPITHRPLDVRHRVQEEDEFIFEPEPQIDDNDDDIEDWDDEEGDWEYESTLDDDRL